LAFSGFSRIHRAIRQRWVHQVSNQRWKRLSAQVEKMTVTAEDTRPVVFFNASTRLIGVSQNAAYSYLTSLGFRAKGIPVVHFVCQAGMQRCVLGSNRDRFDQAPPCEKCVHQSKSLFTSGRVFPFGYETDELLLNSLERLSVASLSSFEYYGLPLGFWAVNSLRWVLRRYTLKEDLQTRAFMAAFILSAYNVHQQFERLVEEVNPQAAVVFNGMFFPEAAVRHVCLSKGIRVVTHEVGIQPFSAFFTDGEATAYPMHIPEDFKLSPEMDARLDEYLSHRFSGNFTMAGIRFWPEMKQLEGNLLNKATQYKKIVPIFTNVIFDTSQVHANTIFEDMFDWLDSIRQTILDHPEVLFVIRAHPDETRAGKESRESVADWVQRNGLISLANVVFVNSSEFVSSYDLIHRSLFVMTYNSTIGLEATLLRKPVLTAGKARYTQLPTTCYPQTKTDYLKKLGEFIRAEKIDIPVEYYQNARRFLYSQLFFTSLPFGNFVKEDGVWNGYVTLKDVTPSSMLPENSETLRVLVDGILHGKALQSTP
jgi:hypothetical protein